ncbi:MAG: ABC transporter permease [Clostridiales bacterium]|nr:ABC transporter permease [Clostridiales bacterium]
MSRKSKRDLISRKYGKRGPFTESWVRMRSNPGAVIGLVILVILMLVMVFSFFFISYEQVTAMDPASRFQPPSAEHPFGTDDMGRDLFLRVLYGIRYSMAVGFGAIALAVVIGTFLGIISGFYGGTLDSILMRALDIWASIPALLLGMVIVTVLGNNLVILMCAIGITAVPGFARITRAGVITVKSEEYIEASRAIGMTSFRTAFTQALPNSLSPLIVTVTARIGTAILEASSLSFLGFGVPVPTPEWGALVSAGRNYLRTASHITLFPGLFIMITVFACSLLGDGLRDALDPRLKQ